MGLSLARWTLKIYEHILWSKFKRWQFAQIDILGKLAGWSRGRVSHVRSIISFASRIAFFTFRRPPRRYIDDILNARQIAGPLWMVWGKRIGVLFPAGSVFSRQRHINPPQTYFSYRTCWGQTYFWLWTLSFAEQIALLNMHRCWESFCILVLLSKKPNWKQIHIGNALASRYCQTNS